MKYLALLSTRFILAETQKVGEAASKITEDGAAASSAIASAVDGLWNDVLGGGLYAAIARLGVFFAVGTLLIFIVQWTKQMVDGENSKAFSELIWPIVVIVLLANNATNLALCTRGLREIINQTNQTLLTSTSNSVRLQEAYQKVVQHSGAESAVRGLMAQCNAIADPQQQTECLKNAADQAEEIADQSNDDKKSWFPDFGLSEFLSTNIFQLAVRGWLIAFSIAFQWLIEISLLLTGLLGPLAVGGSLLPVGQKAIFAWVTGFFSVGMVKLSFNIICGLVATLVLNADANDPLIFAFATGLLAPILSLILAAGAGMAVFNSLSSVATFGLSKLFTSKIF
jgi:ABC-type multidrug transport system fused ATPase/permease subunit